MTPQIERVLRGRISRTAFMTSIIAGYTAIAGVVLGIPLVSYLLSPLIKPIPKVWRDVGAVDSFKVGSTVEVKYLEPAAAAWSGQTALSAAWLRRESPNTFVAYSIYCTHLGCPVHWIQSAQLFLCPCHGSAFYGDGTVAAGPAGNPLVRVPVRIKNGQVQVETGYIPVIG